METNLLVLLLVAAVVALGLAVALLVPAVFKLKKKNAELTENVSYWQEQYYANDRRFIYLTAKKPNRPEKFSDKKYFGACWMSFQNEAREAGVLSDNGGTLELTVLAKK